MDTFRLVVKTIEVQNKKRRVVRYIINNKDFISLVKEVELPYAKSEGYPDTAGQYEGFSKYSGFPLSKKLLGKSAYEGKTELLICVACREVLCWPLLAKIKLTADKVTWSDFENPYRRGEWGLKWKYDKLGPFVFDRKKYEKELRKTS